jgi:hypothetical protein
VLALFADENLDGRLYRGLLRRGLDLLRAQGVGLTGADDPMILDWAARAGRVLVTHDVATMPDHAYERLTQGLAMLGVMVVPANMRTSLALNEIEWIAACSRPEDWEGRVRYLPL